MSTDHTTNSTPSVTPGRARPTRPGWPEIVVGLAAMAAAALLLPLIGPQGIGLDPVTYGVVLSAASGLLGLIGFTVAALIRIRSWAPFAVRRTSWRWVGIGVIAGIVAFLLKGLINTGVVALGFGGGDPQGEYYDGASGGIIPLVLTFVFLAVLTPIGEEFLFRGVITNALLRYGPVIGVIGSSIIFAVAHGINLALPGAIVVGIIAAEVMRRSGSIWPAVIVHSVNNLGLPIFALVAGAAAGA